MGHKKLSPSSATTGFFQEPPRLRNQYEDDAALRRVIACHLPTEIAHDRTFENEMRRMARISTSKLIAGWVEDAETNLPRVESHSAFGKPRNELKTSEGWKRLSQLGTSEGLIALGFENEFGPYSRVVQFSKYFLFAPSSAIVTCPYAMTDGAARLLHTHSQYSGPGRQIFSNAYEKLISRGTLGEEAWSSGQWMTERTGGSDVSQTETVADYAPIHPADEVGPWVINGFKWFSSATDANMTILLAKTTSMPNKISCFYAPLKNKVRTQHGEDWEWNGVRIQRLKQKLGTKAVPTAELELKNMRGWLIGKEGEGIKTISTILNITRVHNIVNASSFQRRGLAVAKAFAEVRTVEKGKPLWKVPLHLRQLARLEVQSRAMMQLAFFTTSLLGIFESPVDGSVHPTLYIPSSTPESVAALFYVLTPLAKALTAKQAIGSLQESMEALGGVGYMENEEHHNLNIARIFRDANVLSIWEGTTNVMCIDLLRSLMGRRREGLKAVNEWIQGNLGVPAESTGLRDEHSHHKHRDQNALGDVRTVLENCKTRLWKSWQGLLVKLESHSHEELTANGRTVLAWLGYIVCGILLHADARKDGDLVAVDVCRRWVLEGVGREGWGGGVVDEKQEWNEMSRAELDSRLVFGRGLGRPKL